MSLNLHNQFDLSDTSALTLCLSVSLWTMTAPCSHSHSEAVFFSLVSFSSRSHNSTVKSVFAMFASSHKEAFVQRIHQEIIQISCTQLGLYVLAVYIWKRESDLHILLCSVSWSLWKACFCCCRWASVCEAHGIQMITSLAWREHHVWAYSPLQKREPFPASSRSISC